MTKQKIGIIGSGVVGQTLANGFLAHGHAVMRGTREPEKLADWKASAGDKASVGTLTETAKFGDVIVLAVKGTGAEEAVSQIAAEINGKAVLDATNPIADAPPTKGVIAFFTGPNDSLMERLQKKVPHAHFVKCFSCVGSALMVNPKLHGGRPSMFICGDDDGAKATTRALLDTFGWDTEDMGASPAARAIEPLCMLWCIPGFVHNDWAHAFKMIRPSA
jgi:hypothetical protein